MIMTCDLWPILIMFFWFFFYNIIKVNPFSYRFIISLQLIFSISLTRSFLVPYAYISIESIDCILLLSFELKTILLISSIKTLCLSLSNLCCVFNINLLLLWVFYDIFTIYASFTFFYVIYFIFMLSCF